MCYDFLTGSFTTEAVVESRDTRDGVQHENEITSNVQDM